MNIALQPVPVSPLIGQVIAQSAPLSKANIGQIMVTIGLLVGALVAITLVWLAIRRKLIDAENPIQAQATALEQLRQLKNRGEITSEQYEAAKGKMAAGLKKSFVPPAAASGNRGVGRGGSTPRRSA